MWTNRDGPHAVLPDGKLGESAADNALPAQEETGVGENGTSYCFIARIGSGWRRGSDST